MFDKKTISKLVDQLLDAMPPGMRAFPKELEKQFHEILQAAFVKMDLVTRKEFDAQVKVLGRLRAKVEALEKKHKK